jgi:hypothetical protein
VRGECQGSVVIPAHNEQSVIGRCLEALTSATTKAAVPCSLEIVVVCNGCTDETAAVASRFPDLTVIEIPEPSKVAALNAGDGVVTTFPRIYLDADSELSNQSAWSLLSIAGDHPDPVIVSASVKPDLGGCSFLARSFSRCAQRTSFGEFGIIGRGVYALNEPGRARFDKFPKLMGDDFFVASLFNTDEQIIDAFAKVVVRPPGDLCSLVRVRSRIYYGNREAGLERSHFVSPQQGWRNFAYAARQARSFVQVFDLAVYASVNLAAKRTASRIASVGESPKWERDNASRGQALTSIG